MLSCSDVNTDRELEKIMNFLFFTFKMTSSAISIAHASALKIEVSFGRRFLVISLYIPGQKYKTTLKNEEKHFFFNL